MNPRLITYIPNTLTSIGAVLGIVAIYFAISHDFIPSIYCLIIAAIIDKVDGAIARYLKCESRLGTKLDSLSDGINFGIFPVVVICILSFPDNVWGQLCAFLTFTVCAVIRLINFTRRKLSGTPMRYQGRYFCGVPTPAAAFLALLPIFISLETGSANILSGYVVIPWLALLGALMVSTVPTFLPSEGNLARIKPAVLIGCGVAVLLLLLVRPLASLIFFDVLYLVSIFLTYRQYKMSPEPAGH